MLNDGLRQGQKSLPEQFLHFVLAEHHLPGQAGNSSSLPVRAGRGCTEMEEKREVWGALGKVVCLQVRLGSLGIAAPLGEAAPNPSLLVGAWKCR